MLHKNKLTQIKKTKDLDLSMLLLERQAREVFKQDKDPVVFFIYEFFNCQDYELTEFIVYLIIMLAGTIGFYHLPRLIVFIASLGGVNHG